MENFCCHKKMLHYLVIGNMVNSDGIYTRNGGLVSRQFCRAVVVVLEQFLNLSLILLAIRIVVLVSAFFQALKQGLDLGRTRGLLLVEIFHHNSNV